MFEMWMLHDFEWMRVCGGCILVTVHEELLGWWEVRASKGVDALGSLAIRV